MGAEGITRLWMVLGGDALQLPAFALAVSVCVMSWVGSQQLHTPGDVVGGGAQGRLSTYLGTGEGAGTALYTDCKGLLRDIKLDLYINIIYICSTPVSGLCGAGEQAACALPGLGPGGWGRWASPPPPPAPQFLPAPIAAGSWMQTPCPRVGV